MRAGAVALAGLASALVGCDDPLEPVRPNTTRELLLARQSAALYHRVEDRLDDLERNGLAILVTTHLNDAQIYALSERMRFRPSTLHPDAAEILCSFLLDPGQIPTHDGWTEADTIETLESILDNVQLTDEQRAGRCCSGYFAAADSSGD